jgi:hypothetical protein
MTVEGLAGLAKASASKLSTLDGEAPMEGMCPVRAVGGVFGGLDGTDRTLDIMNNRRRIRTPFCRRTRRRPWGLGTEEDEDV